MASKEEKLEIADLAFRKGFNHTRIVAALGIPSTKVQGLIEEAGTWLLEEQKRLDDIENKELLPDLANSLRKKYRHLIDVRVVRTERVTTPDEYASLLRKWGRVGANYFDELVEAAETRREDLHVAIGGGETTLGMVSNLAERHRPTVFFHASALIGRGKQIDYSHLGPETNVSVAWSRSGRYPGQMTYATITPHASASRKQIAEELKLISEYDHVIPVLKEMSKVDVVLPGLGLVRPDADPDAGHSLTSTWMLEQVGVTSEILAAEGAVGDMSYCLFRADGTGDAKWNFFPTIGYPNTIEFFRDMTSRRKPVIVIAGVYKERAIRAALKGKLFSVLITDEITARSLIAPR